MERCDATLRDNRHSDEGTHIRRDIDSFFIPQVILLPSPWSQVLRRFRIAKSAVEYVDLVAVRRVSGGVPTGSRARGAYKV